MNTQDFINYATTNYGLSFSRATTGTAYATINDNCRIRISNHPANEDRTELYEMYGIETLNINTKADDFSKIDRVVTYATKGEYVAQFTSGEKVVNRRGEIGVVLSTHGRWIKEVVNIQFPDRVASYYAYGIKCA